MDAGRAGARRLARAAPKACPARSGARRAGVVVAFQPVIFELEIAFAHRELVDLARCEVAGGVADLAFEHLEAADERFVGGATGVSLAAQPGGAALVEIGSAAGRERGWQEG